MTTKKEVVEQFKRDVLGSITPDDQPALDGAWNDYTDYLCKSGEITLGQYQSWTHPKITKKEWLAARSEFHRKAAERK